MRMRNRLNVLCIVYTPIYLCDYSITPMQLINRLNKFSLKNPNDLILFFPSYTQVYIYILIYILIKNKCSSIQPQFSLNLKVESELLSAFVTNPDEYL